MASQSLVLLTEQQTNQLNQWLHQDAKPQELRCILQKLCDKNPDFAKLLFEEALCGTLEVAKDDLSGLNVLENGTHLKGRSASRIAHTNKTPDTPKDSEHSSTTARSSPELAVAHDSNNLNGTSHDATSLTALLQSPPTVSEHNHESSSPPAEQPINKKRKLDGEPRGQICICRKCGCPYDLERDGEQLCIFHSGYMERDDEAWQEIDDYGSISDRDYQLDMPENYFWNCCWKKGDELGCQQGRHLVNCRKTAYADLKLRQS